jgi:hypothetical protein
MATNPYIPGWWKPWLPAPLNLDGGSHDYQLLYTWMVEAIGHQPLCTVHTVHEPCMATSLWMRANDPSTQEKLWTLDHAQCLVAYL